MTRSLLSDGGFECRKRPSDCFARALNIILKDTDELFIIIPVSKQLLAKRPANIEGGGLSNGLENYIENYSDVNVTVCINRNSWAKYEIEPLQSFCQVKYISGVEDERIIGDSFMYLKNATLNGTEINSARSHNLCKHQYTDATSCYSRLFAESETEEF